MPFETISREDRLNEDVVRLLARMGCFRLWIGSESGSQHVLDAMQRRTDAGRVREMVHLLQRHGIEAGMFIMLGYEGEEVADIEATVEHLKLASPDQLLTTVAYPIKGTPYYDTVADRISPLRPWADGSDRDLTVLGRHSRRFYRHATRWMVNELASHRLRGQGGRGLPAAAEDVGERPRRPRRDAADAQRGGARAAVIVSEAAGPFDAAAAGYDAAFTARPLGRVLRAAVQERLAEAFPRAATCSSSAAERARTPSGWRDAACA